MSEIILASGSSTRKTLLSNAGLTFRAQPARIDEAAIKAALLSEKASPRDVADALAEFKARKISEKEPGAVVIGSDQVLDLHGAVLAELADRQAVADQLRALRGKQHSLLSAVVVYENAKPVWRHVGQVRLKMRDISDSFLEAYIDRNWPGIGDSVGGYKLEEEGIRLFTRIEGDYFTVLGLPLMDLLGFLTQRGVIDG